MKNICILLSVFILLTSCLTPKNDDATKEEVIEEVIQEPKTVVEEKPVIYVATEEEYDKTFDEVEQLIARLNRIISTGDFNTWQDYLSESYILKNGDSEYLAKLSDNPVLRDYGIKLKTLKDYFKYVVVLARSNVVIDEIQFISEDKIKALTLIHNEKFVVYFLIKSDEGWIISD